MWRSSLSKLKFEPENGAAVIATGYIDIYEPSGRYQFYVDSMQPEGVGALQLAFEQLVKKLSAEGLFDDEHKQSLPPYPMRIGVVTSQSGAAVHDIVDSVYNRWPCAKMFLWPVLVQGDGAAKDISNAINNINKANKILNLDLLIVGRGGGSLEDLWAFNEEVVARAIFASKIPIISAVGHEVDTTIADYVADVRASTPTKAGVVAVPDMNDILERLSQTQQRLMVDLRRQSDYSRQSLNTILASAVFRNPMSIIANASQRLDDIARQASDGARELFDELFDRLDEMQTQVQKIEPHRLIGAKQLELAGLNNRASTAILNAISKNKLQLAASENKLTALNPKSVLNRGYSITINSRTSKVINKSGDVEVDDEIVTEVANSKKFTSRVTDIKQ